MSRARELLVPVMALLLTLASADDNHSSLTVSDHHCGRQSKYAAGSTYEVNLRHLAATVTADVSTSSCNCSSGRVAGDLPDQVSASAFCPSYFGAKAPSDCSACVALGFKEAQRLCPYEKQVTVEVGDGACIVNFRESSGLGVDFEGDFDFNEISEMEGMFIEVAPSWFLDRDLLFMLLLQATGILCVMLMLLLGWRRHIIN